MTEEIVVEPRTLVLLRHAKSDWPVGVADLERPLAERGRRDAPAAGHWIGERVGTPDLVRVSPALRTRQTWDLVSPHLGEVPDVQIDERVYDATAGDLLDLVRGTDPSVRTLMLVGHNPGTEDLAAVLTGDVAEVGGDEAAREALAEKYPTSGIAVLRFLDEWSHVAPGTGELVAFHIARG